MSSSRRLVVLCSALSVTAVAQALSAANVELAPVPSIDDGFKHLLRPSKRFDNRSGKGKNKGKFRQRW